MFKRLCSLVGGIAICLACGAADKPAEEKTKLALLEQFIGQWVVDGKWASGEELHARTVYEWGINKQIITAKTFVKDKDKEYQRYEVVFAWHPKKKSLYEISFVFNGEIHEVLIDMKDADTLQIGYTSFDEKETS